MILNVQDPFFDQLSRNKILLSTVSAWAIAQILKVLLGVLSAEGGPSSGGRSLRFNFKWFLRSGGMPSSHVALSMCLTTSIGLYYGFDSGLFAMSLGFAVITMFDAQGVRRHSGRQATLLNRILDDIYEHKGVQEARLKELVGHTPIQVYAGGFLGVVVAVLFYAKS